MAEIIMFHHAHGLTDGVRHFADTLVGAGHTVHVPDLYDGHTFTTLEEGVAYAESVGFGTILNRGVAAARQLPESVVYVGFSLGVIPAQKLAQTRPGAHAGVFISACLPVAEFGEEWPATVPVRIHAMESDPFFEEDRAAAQHLVDVASDADLHLYPGKTHLFTDDSLPTFDHGCTETLTTRVLAFLEGMPS